MKYYGRVTQAKRIAAAATEEKTTTSSRGRRWRWRLRCAARAKETPAARATNGEEDGEAEKRKTNRLALSRSGRWLLVEDDQTDFVFLSAAACVVYSSACLDCFDVAQRCRQWNPLPTNDLGWSGLEQHTVPRSTRVSMQAEVLQRWLSISIFRAASTLSSEFVSTARRGCAPVSTLEEANRRSPARPGPMDTPQRACSPVHSFELGSFLGHYADHDACMRRRAEQAALVPRLLSTRRRRLEQRSCLMRPATARRPSTWVPLPAASCQQRVHRHPGFPVAAIHPRQ